MKKVYSVSVNDTLVFRDKKKTEYYVNDRQYRLYVKGLFNSLKNQRFLKSFHKQAQAKLESILKKTQRKLTLNLTKLSNKELLKIYKDFILPNLAQFYVRMWTVFNIAVPLEDLLFSELKKSGVKESAVPEYLLTLVSQQSSNDVLQERMNLLKIAARKKSLNSQKLQELIVKHTNKYKHIPMFDFDHEPFTEKYFANELNLVRNPEKELKEIKRALLSHKKQFQRLVQALKPGERLKLLIEFARENVFLRDYRDMIRQRLNLELRKFYQEIGRRLGLTIEEVAGLTNDEIIKYLGSGKKFPKGEAKKRKSAFLLIQQGRSVKIYSGKKALVLARRELSQAEQKKVKEVMGIIGSRGIARGKVKIVFTNKDLYKVQKNDVLMATMTRQDFVPAMRKATAVVTDEGSMISHAAIIARELKIPCIVATKIGTKVFKDGDLVEVDAEKGVVRRISRRDLAGE